MATKDWKEIKKGHYRCFKKPYELVIYKNEFGGWIVILSSRVHVFDVTKYRFDTEDEAKNYAKEVMRRT